MVEGALLVVGNAEVFQCCELLMGVGVVEVVPGQ